MLGAALTFQKCFTLSVYLLLSACLPRSLRRCNVYHRVLDVGFVHSSCSGVWSACFLGAWILWYSGVRCACQIREI